MSAVIWRGRENLTTGGGWKAGMMDARHQRLLENLEPVPSRCGGQYQVCNIKFLQYVQVSTTSIGFYMLRYSRIHQCDIVRTLISLSPAHGFLLPDHCPCGRVQQQLGTLDVRDT